MFEEWSEIKKYREEKGIGLETLSEKMRVTVEKIRFLETGDFTDADPVITRLHLKNYARLLGLDTEEVLALSGLEKQVSTELPDSLHSPAAPVKKTHAYRGRKKSPSKLLIYTLAIAGFVVLLVLLNVLSRHFQFSNNLYEMTEMQRKSLDQDRPLGADSLRLRPILPQMSQQDAETDILENMEIFSEFEVNLPLEIKIFPRKTLSYRHEPAGETPLENYILKDIPQILTINKPGRIVFYNTLDTRFVIGDLAFRDKEYACILIDISRDRTLRLYTESLAQ